MVGRKNIAWIIAPNEQMMVSAGGSKGNKIQTEAGNRDVLSRHCDNTPVLFLPPFLYPLYTDVPLNATYGSPFRKVASRIFVGWAVSLHVVDNGLPFRPRPLPPFPTTAVSHSPPPSGSLDLRERVVRRWWWVEVATQGGTGMCGAHSGRKI